MRSKLVIVCGLVVLGLAALPATAGIAPLGDPLPHGSWAQTFRESGVGPFDHFQMLMVGPDLWETPTGIESFSAGGWAQTYNDGHLLVADGPAVSDMTFNLIFDGAKSEPFLAYFQAYSGGALVDDATVQWTGSSWKIAVPSAWGETNCLDGVIPLPGAALLGAFGLGMVSWVKRRL